MSISRLTLIAALILSLTFCAPLRAQQPPADPLLRDLNIGLSRARFSGAPAVLVFSANWCGYCEKLENFLLDPKVRPVSDKAVLILIDVNANPELLRRFTVEGHHVAVVLAWDGSELARMSMDGKPDALLAVLSQAVATNEIDAADVLFKLDRLAKAADRAQGVLAIAKDGPQSDRARKMLDVILTRSREQLAKARELLKTGHLADCARACDSLAESFPESMVAADVKKMRRDIERVRQGHPLPESLPVETPEVIVARRAQDLVDRALVAEWDRQYYRAVQLYEQAVRDFPAEKSADEARARLKSLRENPGTLALIKQQEIDLNCRRLIQMARAYSLSGHPEQARDYYQRIVKDYPETAWAGAAKDELAKLKN